jgi:cytochrome c7-like protein
MSKDKSAKGTRGLASVRLLVISFSLSLTLHPGAAVIVQGGGAGPQRRPRARRPARRPPAPRTDYSQFSHATHVTTQKLACDSCHKFPTKNWKEVRKGDAAFDDVAEFPEHSACLNCHRPQFFARERPAPAICSNCHVAVTPKNTARWLFPSLGDVIDSKSKTRAVVSEFGVGFPHDKHLDVISFNFNSRPLFVNASFQKKDGPPASCQVCHQTYQPQGNSSEEYLVKPPRDIGDAFWLKKGTFKTSPNSHAACFTCHSADSGLAPEPKNCDACHKLLAPAQLKTDFDAQLAPKMGADRVALDAWSRRISAGAFRHEAGEHPDLNCLKCHDVASASFSPVDPKTTKVSVRSCGGADGCHITATADDGGALNFEIDQKKESNAFVCVKCHVTFGKEAIPENHRQAIPTPAKK